MVDNKSLKIFLSLVDLITRISVFQYTDGRWSKTDECRR